MIDMLISCPSCLCDLVQQHTTITFVIHSCLITPFFLCPHLSSLSNQLPSQNLYPQTTSWLKHPSAFCTYCLSPISGYTFNTEAHALRCTNKHGGFGDSHVAGPYGVAVQSTVKNLLADSNNYTSSASNHCTDLCPEWTKKRLHTMGSKVA